MDVALEWIRPGDHPCARWYGPGGFTVLPGMELMGCRDLAVPAGVMQHVVRVESSFNPYAIGVVGGRLARQPGNLPEALATARMLESRGFNFSLGLAQVNRYNLARYGLTSYEQAFRACPNLQAGSRILAECHQRAGRDWGKSFSCYYSGNFVTGFRQGYVQKIYASMRGSNSRAFPAAIPVYGTPIRRGTAPAARVTSPATLSRVENTAPRDSSAAAPQPTTPPPGGAGSIPAYDRDALVVLQPDGQAPRVVAADPQAPPASARTDAGTSRDAAFVF